ncbi:MAG: outer membrane lipoprotein-sorting protein [Psychrosphaera sp.]|nr:outer membrane lipoprotein-sorting protein [Psychrosphaera sp.]
MKRLVKRSVKRFISLGLVMLLGFGAPVVAMVEQASEQKPETDTALYTETATATDAVLDAPDPALDAAPDTTTDATPDATPDTTTDAAPTAEALLSYIDSLRGYQDQSFSFELSNISYKKNKQKHRNKLVVKVLNDASLVEFVAPARSKGRKILKQAQNMWIRFPRTRNVLRVSPAQRLLGETSNGDVTGTNFSEDYTATLEDSETAPDKSETDKKPLLKLLLTAKHDKTTYQKVVFFLDSENHQPVRSDFYARSGKLAKQAYYTEFKEFDGELKLHKMRLVNPIIEGSFTWMMFDNYKKQTLEPAIFHKDALSR